MEANNIINWNVVLILYTMGFAVYGICCFAKNVTISIINHRKSKVQNGAEIITEEIYKKVYEESGLNYENTPAANFYKNGEYEKALKIGIGFLKQQVKDLENRFNEIASKEDIRLRRFFIEYCNGVGPHTTRRKFIKGLLKKVYNYLLNGKALVNEDSPKTTIP